MVEKAKSLFCRFYILLIIIFLYAPIAVLIILSFNDSRSRVVWGGFTLRWYVDLLHNNQIRAALATTFLLAFLSALVPPHCFLSPFIYSIFILLGIM